MADVPAPGLPPTTSRRFMQLLIAEMEKGYTSQSTLKAESWEYICRRVNIECAEGLEVYRVPYLKANLLNLKQRYNDFSALLALNGVEWDVRTNKVIANESIWKAYYRAHPKADIYVIRGERDFELMRCIFESGVRFD